MSEPFRRQVLDFSAREWMREKLFDERYYRNSTAAIATVGQALTAPAAGGEGVYLPLLKRVLSLRPDVFKEALASHEEALRLGKENARGGIEECRSRLAGPAASDSKKGRSNLSPEDPSDYYNLAIRSIQQGNRVAAVNYYLKALNALDEETGNSRAFKAFVAHQCGVCVLKHYEMEGVDPRQYAKKQHDRAAMIRKLWGSTLRLATTLGPEDLAAGFGAMLPRAVRSTMDDVIMKCQ